MITYNVYFQNIDSLLGKTQKVPTYSGVHIHINSVLQVPPFLQSVGPGTDEQSCDDVTAKKYFIRT